MRHEAKPRSRLVAGDADRRSDVTSHGQADYVVGGGRDIRHQLSADVAMAPAREEHFYEGLRDRRWGRASEKRVALKQVEEVRRLYQEQYFDFNVRHFHEKLVADHGIQLSYTCACDC